MARTNFKSEISIAIVGEETLLGKDLSDVLASRIPEAAFVGFAASGEGNFGETEGEAVYVEPVTEAALGSASAVLIAGTPAGAQKIYDLAKAMVQPPLIIDCTGYLEHLPEARMAAPLFREVDVRQSWLFSMAHPAASALALLLWRLAKYRSLRQMVVNIFEPASEYGKKGLTELHQQTTGLLAFKPLEKDVFDSQLSFNLLAQLGEEAPVRLAATEQRIERHLAMLLDEQQTHSNIPRPSVRLIAAPVFHGFSLSVWAEFAAPIQAQELGEALASAQIEVRSAKEEAPHNVGVAGQSGLSAGDIRLDRNNPQAAWIWVVGDNLRLMADGAIDLVSAIREVVR
ncbi:MAG TPA: Asd/ArgC dimerization domain-containing protein [Bryobacteraceae bacterium]|nr:Asd/ArgC dimerization domain-containing protein [Bryobacteraceae bacterium]